ncbi:MAG: diphthine--ammonia ligase [Thaumarchaeota archaeon]|nr:diphthine--ammonia ligase [Nitrososphaerota archaeon]
MGSEVRGLKGAAVLWTGGKDCSMAFYKAELSGYKIEKLVTFTPRKGKFLAHRLSFMKYQAQALATQHLQVIVEEPFKQNYKKAILSLRDRYGIEILVTGDIAEVNEHPNWISECCQHSGVDLLTPLWGFDRCKLLQKILSCGFKVIFSCVKKPWLSEDWLGRELNKNSIERLSRIGLEKGFDICGEQGEYHTLVLDGPIFEKSFQIGSYTKHKRNSIMYLDLHDVALQDKIPLSIEAMRTNAVSRFR